MLKNKKILLLHLNPGPKIDKETLIADHDIEQIRTSLSELGLDFHVRGVSYSVSEAVKGFAPEETVILNLAEGFGDDDDDFMTVPRELDRLGFVYTGGDEVGLAWNCDKTATKEILLNHGLATPKHFFYDRDKADEWDIFPALVKPSGKHCSYGITRESVVDSREQLIKRAEELIKLYGPVMVEDFIEGEEYNISIWGNDPVEVLPVSVIDYSKMSDYHDQLCVFDAKWHEGSEAWNKTDVTCPAKISKLLENRIKDLALGTYKALRGRDYLRVDMRVRNEKPYVLDVNQNPDITAGGGFFRSVNHAGYSFGGMLYKILEMAEVRLAVKTVQDRQGRSFSANEQLNFGTVR